MRLPEGQDGESIKEECQRMSDYAMAHGITYFDSAWHYVENQLMIGKCLAKYPRESYVPAGKLFFDGTLNTGEKAETAFQKEPGNARVEYNNLVLLDRILTEHPEIKALFASAGPSMTPASRALRCAAGMEGDMIILSGMSGMEQMRQNIQLMQEDFRPLTGGDKDMLKKAARSAGTGPPSASAAAPVNTSVFRASRSVS